MDVAELPSDDVRTMLRESLRGFLGEHWTLDNARSVSPVEVSAVWRRLAGQGVASLGCARDEGGLREIMVVMDELGRAACPAPMWSAALANLALSGVCDEAAAALLEPLHAGASPVAFSFGAIDPDRQAASIRTIEGRLSGLVRFVEV